MSLIALAVQATPTSKCQKQLGCLYVSVFNGDADADEHSCRVARIVCRMSSARRTSGVLPMVVSPACVHHPCSCPRVLGPKPTDRQTWFRECCVSHTHSSMGVWQGHGRWPIVQGLMWHPWSFNLAARKLRICSLFALNAYVTVLYFDELCRQSQIHQAITSGKQSNHNMAELPVTEPTMIAGLQADWEKETQRGSHEATQAAFRWVC